MTVRVAIKIQPFSYECCGDCKKGNNGLWCTLFGKKRRYLAGIGRSGSSGFHRIKECKDNEIPEPDMNEYEIPELDMNK